MSGGGATGLVKRLSERDLSRFTGEVGQKTEGQTSRPSRGGMLTLTNATFLDRLGNACAGNFVQSNFARRFDCGTGIHDRWVE